MTIYNFNWNLNFPQIWLWTCDGVGQAINDPIGSTQWWGVVAPGNRKIGPFSCADAAKVAVQTEWSPGNV